MAVTLPPQPQPLTSLGRDEFDDAMFALVAWFYVMVPEFEAAILALDANDVRGSSSTSFTPNSSGLGSKAFATQSGKSWLPGMWVTGGYTSDGKEYWAGVVESYSAGTLTVNVKVVSGHGTARTSWQISMSPPITDLVGDNEVVVHSPNGYASTNTKIRRFSTIHKNSGSDITYADSATIGASFTINTPGMYLVERAEDYASAGGNFGVTVNSASLTTSVNTLAFAERVLMGEITSLNGIQVISTIAELSAGDVLRPHDGASSLDSTANAFYMKVKRIR